MLTQLIFSVLTELTLQHLFQLPGEQLRRTTVVHKLTNSFLSLYNTHLQSCGREVLWFLFILLIYIIT